MSRIQAPWLGSWKPPWDLGRGRRWGDPVWALAAIAQAWLLGGREGRWPLATWEAKRPTGPRIAELPAKWAARPDPEWISLWRHGSAKVPPQDRGKREDELLAWCWESLLQGDGAPWMAYGTVLLDAETRARWVPVLGAVDETGCLQLPPFLDPLIPEPLKSLPEGWWPFLLGAMDPQGRLLPEGTPSEDLPWSLLAPGMRDLLEPLILDEEQGARLGVEWQPWARRLPCGWILDPCLRAWARGHGASPVALASLRPQALALGDAPRRIEAEILAGRVPVGPLPEGWEASLGADLEEGPRPEPPPPCGDPVLDRIRGRWGRGLPEPTPGYPPWGEGVHPCADPFHWMAEGQRAFHSQELEGALRAFTWAHAHFLRLRSHFWAERAAANAETAALYWGGLPVSEAWRRARGAQVSPYREHSEAQFHATRDEWEKAVPLFSALTETHPELLGPWIILAQRGMKIGREDWVRDALLRLEAGDMGDLLKAHLEGMVEAAPAGVNPEIRLQWELQRVLRGRADAGNFWRAWPLCPNGPLRLGTALDLMEACPRERTPERLLALQVLADRTGAPRLQERLRGLWPFPEPERSASPEVIVEENLRRLGRPAWFVRGGPLHPLVHGVGEAPPEGALSGLREMGYLPPFVSGSWIWRGFPIHWEGAVVARVLVAFRPDEPVTSCDDLSVLAPWLARMSPAEKVLDSPAGGELLAEGSEPMGSVLRELAQVAPSNLPVLILGPTGSGKELLAQEVHRRSGRPGSLVPVNVTAFAEGVLESELFGHVKGAFTGADRERKGAIEAAEGGTLFLDEVADLSPRLQSMLLRVLQDRMVRRVGSDRSRLVDVRFVSATHKSLKDLVASGLFRQDLFFRLQGTVLELPPLRARRHEFPYLVPRLVALLAREAQTPCPEIAPGLAQALGALPWPGNFRELRHALQRALLRCAEGPLQPGHFPELEAPVVQSCTWEEGTREFQRKLLLETLRRHHFQITDAARCLGLTRPALYLAAKRLGLDLTAERARQAS